MAGLDGELSPQAAYDALAARIGARRARAMVEAAYAREVCAVTPKPRAHNGAGVKRDRMKWPERDRRRIVKPVDVDVQRAAIQAGHLRALMERMH